MVRALEGIRVLDWTQWQMGAIATSMLADLGAEVIHIENRITGDAGRGELGWMELPNGESSYFEINNRGKKSITLDLNKEKGREILYRLVSNSDVFVHNFRQGIPERLKLDYETLSQHNPRLVYVSASGYGPEGPEAKEPSFDYIGQARSGLMTMVGEPDMPPQVIGGGIVDQAGGIMTSYGVLVALLVKERLGIGQKVDASHLGSMMLLMGLAIGRRLYLQKDWPLENRTNVRSPLWNYYPCKGGRWIMLAMIQGERYWPDVCRALGIGDLIDDPRFSEAASREKHSKELVHIMGEIFMTKTVNEWVRILKENGDIICCPVQTMADLENDPQVIANKYIIDYNHESLGPVKVLGAPLGLSKTPVKIRAESPKFGQHTEDVLINVGGYTWEDIARLKEEEII